MNPREIIMTSEEANHPNFAGLLSKIAAVVDSPVKENSIPASRPRRSKNLASKSIDIFPLCIVVELMLRIHIVLYLFFIPCASKPQVLERMGCLEKDMDNM